MRASKISRPHGLLTLCVTGIMSFLGGLFGLKPADKGKVLGSKATSPAAASEASQKEFDVTFTEQVSPGMTEYV